jgi:outer membrane protein
MPFYSYPVRPLSVLLLLAPAVGFAQQSDLTLNQALEMAREKNGTIRSAYSQVEASRQQVIQSRAPFLPTVTPTIQYNSVRNDGSQLLYKNDGWVGALGLSWTVLDSGERDFTYRSSRASLESQRFSARNTLRNTLFTVAQQYFDTLRAQQELKVSGSTVERAKTILDQTDARIQVRDAAKIERLQANVDFQNAKVQSLSARNQVTNAAATLKATVGLDGDNPLPPLRDEPLALIDLPDDVSSLVAEGFKNRPDLISQRLAIQALEYSRQKAEREAGPTFALTLNNTYQFTPSGTNNRNVTLMASYPLFDAGLSRAIARQIAANIESSKALLLQSERSARAAIEADYAADKTNREKLAAAQIALDAAKENYLFAVDSRDKGGSDLLTVLTAQVSLVTAESNFIQAQYDTRIADIQLRLDTGRPIPGEPAA